MTAACVTGAGCGAGGSGSTGGGKGAASEAARSGAGAALSITTCGVADSGVLCRAGAAAGTGGTGSSGAASVAGNSSCVAARPKRRAVMLPGLRANSPLAAELAAGSEGKRFGAESLRNTCTTICSATVCSGQYRLAINSSPTCAAITASPTPGWARSCGGGAINRDLVTRSMFPQLSFQAEASEAARCKKLIWKLTFHIRNRFCRAAGSQKPPKTSFSGIKSASRPIDMYVSSYVFNSKSNVMPALSLTHAPTRLLTQP